MRRPQFSIKTLLWLTLIVAAFFSGMAVERNLAKRKAAHKPFPIDFVGGVHSRDLELDIDDLVSKLKEASEQPNGK